LSINIGNIYAKKSLVEDTADAIAPILLANQVSRTIPDKDGNLQATDGAKDTAKAILEDSPILQSTYLPVFGIWDNDTNQFCQFGLPQGNEEDCLVNAINKNISRTDPNLNNVYLEDNEDFALAFQLNHDVNPLSNLIDFSAITLRGRAIAQTNILKLTDDPDIDSDNNCCCDWAGDQNSTNTTYSFLGCVKINSSTRTFPILMPPLDELCAEWAVLSKILTDGGSQTCKDYMTCNGTILERLFGGGFFSSFLEYLQCWFNHFVENLIKTITIVTTAMDDAWNGWT
jgi:Flp pilus assembly protein TadG